MKAFLDIETGGFSISKNGVCEIAVVITDNNLEPVAEYQSLIKPYYRECGLELVSYKDDAMAVNGILVSDLETKGQDICEVIGNIIDLLKNHNAEIIIGHNSSTFDIPRMKHLCSRFHAEKTFFDLIPLYDTMKIAKGFLTLPSYSLQNLCTHYGIVNQREHSALGDTYATIELYQMMTTR